MSPAGLFGSPRSMAVAIKVFGNREFGTLPKFAVWPQRTTAASHEPVYPDVLPCMGFKPSDGQSIIPHKGTVLAPQNSYRRPGPHRPLWRKRETFLQERIVQYTTVDAEGGVQELVETERSSTEVSPRARVVADDHGVMSSFATVRADPAHGV